MGYALGRAGLHFGSNYTAFGVLSHDNLPARPSLSRPTRMSLETA